MYFILLYGTLITNTLDGDACMLRLYSVDGTGVTELRNGIAIKIGGDLGGLKCGDQRKVVKCHAEGLKLVDPK